MSNFSAEDVYDTLNGTLWEGNVVPGVENAFGEGMLCHRLYQQIYAANGRLCQRLGKIDEDADVELIINNFLEINRILCLEMYRYGQLHSKQ